MHTEMQLLGMVKVGLKPGCYWGSHFRSSTRQCLTCLHGTSVSGGQTPRGSVTWDPCLGIQVTVTPLASSIHIVQFSPFPSARAHPPRHPQQTVEARVFNSFQPISALRKPTSRSLAFHRYHPLCFNLNAYFLLCL